MKDKKMILSKIRKGKKITQKEANKISIEDYKKAKNQYRGYKNRKISLSQEMKNRRDWNKRYF